MTGACWAVLRWWVLCSLLSGCSSLLVHRRSGNHGWNDAPSWAGYGFHTYPHPDRSPAAQRDVMVEVVNDLGLKLLAIHNENNEDNIAISPYGALSILVALGEGLQGDAVRELQRAVHLPNDISIIRIGLRDIHRHLKSYFIPREGFLAGLTLNHDNVTLRPEYEDVLKFYGFDIMSFNNALYPDPQTTEKPIYFTTTENQSHDITSTLVSTTPEKAPEITRTILSTTTEKGEEITSTTLIETTTLVQTTASTPSSTSTETSTASSTLVTIPSTDESSTDTITTESTTNKESIITSTEPDTTTDETSTFPSTLTTSDANGVSLPITTTTEQLTITTTESTVTSSAISTASETTITEKPSSTNESPTSTITEGTTVSDETTKLVLAKEDSETSTPVPENTDSTATTVSSVTVTTEIPRTITDEEDTVMDSTEQNVETTTTTATEISLMSSTSMLGSETSAELSTLTSESTTLVSFPYPDASAPPVADITTRMMEENEINSTEGVAKRNALFESNNGVNRTTRKSRSLIDYIIARHYDGDQTANHLAFLSYPETPHLEPYLPQTLPDFLVQGKFPERNVHYMRYDTVLPFAFLSNLRAFALSFPLDSEKYYLLLLLPLDEAGIDELICDLRLNGNLKGIVEGLRYRHVVAVIPNFMLKGYVNLTPSLQKLGVRKVFEPGRADFSPMTKMREIYITNIEQAISVNIRNYVDPEAYDTRRQYTEYNPIEFRADHPFLYFVIDAELHVALMAGKIVNPLNSRIT